MRCTPGRYADAGDDSNQCTICPAGSRCPITTSSAAVEACPFGHISEAESVECDPCPPGYECPDKDAGSSNNDVCPVGTFSGGTAEACTTCPAGYSCVSTASTATTPCTPGFYSILGQMDCRICPEGAECPVTSLAPQSCPAGRFSATTGATNCTACPPGFECPATVGPYGQVEPDPCPANEYSGSGFPNCQDCNPGWACQPRSTSPEPEGAECPIGGYCPGSGVGWTACAAGTRGLTRGLTSQAECDDCTPGFFCRAGATDPRRVRDTMFVCPPGTYCEAGRATPQNCPVRTYNPEPGAISDTQCLDCPAGYWCNAGTSEPQECPPGSYCEVRTRFSSITHCTGGTFGGGQRYRLESQSDCFDCPPGHYCPDDDTADPIQCPQGTYNTQTRRVLSSDCQDCPAGWACP